MPKLKILVPHRWDPNPCLFELIRSLQLRPEVETVQHGLEWLQDSQMRFDVVHIQWPEAMLDWRKADNADVQFISEKIEQWKMSGTAIVATVHNLGPNQQVNRHAADLYETVYGNCDAIVHLGRVSRKLAKQKIAYSIPEDREFVVPHGDYSFFKNEVSREKARARFGISEGGPVFVAVGQTRNLKEIGLLQATAEFLSDHGGTLLVGGRISGNVKNSPRGRLMTFFLAKRRNVVVHDRLIPAEEIQYYLNAAEVLLVPRVKSLNSGNVSLGFTFGKVVVGTSYGVIGETLMERGNPVFDPDSMESFNSALQDAMRLSAGGTGAENKAYALKAMNWPDIAAEHVRIYNTVAARS